ncbi:MAG: hypothetical protein ACTSUE_15760 [Promethearchaeota archaeon]
MNSFPLSSFQELFGKYFQSTALEGLYIDMCKVVGGEEYDPYTVVNKLRLRFFNYDDDEFDLDDWLINAGIFILVLKSILIRENGKSSPAYLKLIDWFQDTLRKSKDDLLDDEIPYYFSFMFNSEFMRYHGVDAPVPSEVVALSSFIDDNFQEISRLPSFTRVKSLSLVVPFFLDLIKVHGETLKFLIEKLDVIIVSLSEDDALKDEALGLCARTLAFKTYDVEISEEFFAWALLALKEITMPFIKLTASVNIAIGYSLKGEIEECTKLLTSSLIDNYHMPPPTKEINVAFLTRGAIEARVENLKIHKDIRVVLEEIIENTVETILSMNEKLNSDDELLDDEFKEMMDVLEIGFTILSAILDNMSIAGVHVHDVSWIEFSELLLNRVNEVNLTLKFKSRFMLYYSKVDVANLQDSIEMSKDILSLFSQEVETLYFDEIVDFFMEYSKNAIELAFIHSDDTFLSNLETVLSIIKQAKNLEVLDEEAYQDPNGEDMMAILYQILSSISALVNEKWNHLFKLNLLQGYALGSLS